jgi:hypothetical protein
MSRSTLEAYRIESVANFKINFHWRGNYVNYTFRAMYLLGMVESTQGIILLGKMCDFWQRLLGVWLCAHLTNPWRLSK